VQFETLKLCQSRTANLLVDEHVVTYLVSILLSEIGSQIMFKMQQNASLQQDALKFIE